MNRYIWIGLLAMVANAAIGAEPSAVTLPPGVKAVWDLGKAYRETTPTRERICINGLWRWQPAEAKARPAADRRTGATSRSPAAGRASPTTCRRTARRSTPIRAGRTRAAASVTAAWYPAGDRDSRRSGPAAASPLTIGVPEFLRGRLRGRQEGGRDAVSRRARWTSPPLCRPGGKHVLSLLVVAMPLKGVMLSFNDTASRPAKCKGSVARRGLCGDVYLVGTPAGPRIADVKVDTSVRKWEITFDAALEGLAPDAQYALRAADHRRTAASVKEFTSKPFQAGDLKDGRIAVHREVEAREALGHPHAAEQYDVERLAAGRRRQGARHRPARAFRLPRVLDRRPRLLPERHPHLPLRRPAGQRPGRRRAGHLRGRQGEPAAAARASASTSSTPTTTAASRART